MLHNETDRRKLGVPAKDIDSLQWAVLLQFEFLD